MINENYILIIAALILIMLLGCGSDDRITGGGPAEPEATAQIEEPSAVPPEVLEALEDEYDDDSSDDCEPRHKNKRGKGHYKGKGKGHQHD